VTRIRFVMLGVLMSASLGCASAQVASEKKFATGAKDKATVYFYRESVFQGSFVNWTIWEKRETPVRVGVLKNGSYFFVQLPPGKRAFSLESDGARSKEVDLKAGKTYFFQSRLDMGAVSSARRLAEVTEDEGMSAIKDDGMVMTVPEAM
jgi:hypothetical protein